YVPSSAADPYQLDIGELDKLVAASDNPVRMLLINSPNNPTGQMLSPDFLQELAAYCRANRIIVLSDEIYFQVSHGEVEHVSMANYYPEGCLVLGGLSKHLSIGGWRLGVALLPDSDFGKALISKLLIFASETWSGVSAPIQYAAINAYSLEPGIEQYVKDCSAIHAIRTRFCRQYLVDIGINCSRAEGAFYIAANFDKYSAGLEKLGITTSPQLSRFLLGHYHIASLPGPDFGIPARTLTLRLSTSYLDMENANDSQRIFDLYQTGVDAEVFISAPNHPVTRAALSAFTQFLQSIS
ncbi:MAG: pyridoxal phosphate-dependent aminotransferase, partial [Gammaproteobacteria bacterium]|nr:pyridoxal phosphate-dependent aminotransferase [Gammaproteobacteria bacterium]